MLKVTMENFNEVASVLFYGLHLFDNYNRECFGMSDLKLAHSARCHVHEFEQALQNAGYQSVNILDPIAREFQCEALNIEPNPTYKATVDNELSLELPDSLSWYNYVKAYKNTNENQERQVI